MKTNKVMKYTKRKVRDLRVEKIVKEIFMDMGYEIIKSIEQTGTVDPKIILLQTAEKQLYKGGLV